MSILTKSRVAFITCGARPSGFWSNTENVQNYLKSLSNDLNLETMEDWKSLTKKQIKNHGGAGIFRYYRLNQVKSIGYPEGNFIIPEKPMKKRGFWKNLENVVKFITVDLKQKLNLNSFEDWNSLSYNQVKENGGVRLLSLYSLYEIKCIGFPEGKSLFLNTKPSGYWTKFENRKKFIFQLKEKLNLQTFDDWNSLSFKQIESNGGGSLLHIYSLHKIKSIGYPEGKKLFAKPIVKKETGFWEDKTNIQDFLNKLKVKLNLNTIDDWNTLTQRQVIENGGFSLLTRYTLYDIKTMGCPDGKLVFFHHTKRKQSGYWEKKENIQFFLESLKNKFQLNSKEDWLRISTTQINAHGGHILLLKYSKEEILKRFVFTEEKDLSLEVPKFMNARSAQRWLFLQVLKIFPGEEIVEDYFHTEISRKNGFPVQFDIFLVNKNIAIEYHGEQHYKDVPVFAPLEMYLYRDNEKKNLCKNHGIQLIIIPFDWDKQLDSLKQFIGANV